MKLFVKSRSFARACFLQVESVVGNVVLYAARLGALLARQARALRVEVESRRPTYGTD